MAALTTILEFFQSYFWQILGGGLSIGYVVVMVLMIRKAMRDSQLPEDLKPGPRPMFYLGQAYLAFVWPVPLFLALEALDVLILPF